MGAVMYIWRKFDKREGLIIKMKITNLVNHCQFTKNHIPVHVVLVIIIDKHLPKTNHIWPTAVTNMCKDFSYRIRSISNTQNSFCSPRNNLLNIIIGF